MLVNMLPNVAKKTMRLMARCRKADEHEKVTSTKRHPNNEKTDPTRSMVTTLSRSRWLRLDDMMVGLGAGGAVRAERLRHLDQGRGARPGICTAGGWFVAREAAVDSADLDDGWAVWIGDIWQDSGDWGRVRTNKVGEKKSRQAEG